LEKKISPRVLITCRSIFRCASSSGYGNYLPFLRFAESLNIPWLILSDAETDAETDAVTSVKRQFNDSGSLKVEADVIVFLDNGNDIEKQLIKDGYQDEIKKALIARGEYHNEQHKVKKETEIKAYGDDKIYKLITGAKTQSGFNIQSTIERNNNRFLRF
jgi:hypothetical protein